MFRGSRKHVLDWVEQPGFVQELIGLFPHIDLNVPALAMYMPRGYKAADEARLEHFGPRWLQSTIWVNLQDWWLLHKRGANTPNWDIVLGCIIESRPGLVLVEAKANWNELKVEGKAFHHHTTKNGLQNHNHIGRAIEEACLSLQRVDPRFAITRDSHYQLANRIAFTWKLAMLGIPVILAYIGFTGDEGIRDAGAPFRDDQDWQRAFEEYARGILPIDSLDRRIDLGPAPIWLTRRSRSVIERSSPRG
jgi:hypothetical protein